MAEYTVSGLIEVLQNGYKPDETIMATWYTSADVVSIISDEGWGEDGLDDFEFAQKVWHHVAHNVDIALDYAESEINSEIFGFVESYVMRGEK